MQGLYVFAPSGRLLARINSLDADANRKTLETALAKWGQLEDSDKILDDRDLVAPRFRWEDSYPKRGLVLLRTARDLPQSLDPAAKKAKRYNRDSIWFSKDEARAWLPERLEVGAERVCELRAGDARARKIAMRLAQLALVDNSRGQTLPYHKDEIEHLRFVSVVRRVDSGRVDIDFSLNARAVAKGPWLWGDNYWKPKRRQERPHSIATRMLGTASFDIDRARFVDFEAVALGWHRGSTVMNGRGRKPEPGPIGFVLRLARPTWRVAPTFINVYDAPWVRRPGAAK